MKKITILFDLDGTLIDSTEAILLSFWDVFDKIGIDRPKEDDIKKQIGHTLEDMFLSFSIDNDMVKECVKEYKLNYRKRSLSMTKLLPNAKEAVEFASLFARIGAVTTKTGKYSRDILEHLDIMKYFEVLIGREDVVYPKPHKEPIEKALKFLDAKREYCWMVGDTILDLLSSKNARINAVGVLSGYGKGEDLLSLGYEVVVDALEAVRYINLKYQS